jgi:hypothetical protein
MEKLDILKLLLMLNGPVKISKDDLDQIKNKQVGIIETVNDQKTEYVIYTHDTRK